MRSYIEGDHSQLEIIYFNLNKTCGEKLYLALPVSAWFCVFKHKGSMIRTSCWPSALAHCPHCAVDVLVYLPVLQIRSWVRGCHFWEQLIWGMELRFRPRLPDSCWGNPLWALRVIAWFGDHCMPEQFWAKIISVWLYNVFHDDCYWPPSASHSDKFQVLVPLKHHP